MAILAAEIVSKYLDASVLMPEVFRTMEHVCVISQHRRAKIFLACLVLIQYAEKDYLFAYVFPLFWYVIL